MINKKHITKVLGGFLLLTASFLSSCSKVDDFSDSIVSVDAKPSIDFLALTSANQLLRYNANNSGQALGGLITISGLQTSETIVAIDYRPATGQLYALGMVSANTARIYILPVALTTTSTSAASVTARLVGSTISTTGGVSGFDFDPVTDKIRFTTTTGQNFSVNPETGVATSQTGISGSTDPRVTGLAYTNNYAGATSTTLYGLDVANQKIYTQDGENGTLTELGLTGLNALPTAAFTAGYNTNINNARRDAPGGFDIAPNGTALAVLMNNSAPAIPKDGIVSGSPSSAVNAVTGTATLFQINLETGKATDLGAFSIPVTTTATQITGIAIMPRNTAYAINAADNNLLIFDPRTPGEPISKAITGLQSNETILAIDFRNASIGNAAQLFALGSDSRLYTIDLGSGAATAVGSQFGTLLDGTAFGFDCNPTNSSAFRVISNTGQNMRINYSTGSVTTYTSITTHQLTANAITNASSNAVLFAVGTETGSDVVNVYKQDPESTGITTFVKVGKLGLAIDSANGFDIGGASGNAFGIFTVNGNTRIYQVNTTTGLAVTPGVAFPYAVRGFALAPAF